MKNLILLQCMLLYGTYSTLGLTSGEKGKKWISQCFNVELGQPLISMSCVNPGKPGMIMMKNAFHGKAKRRHYSVIDFKKCHNADGVDIKCTYCPEDCTDDSLTMAYDWTKCTGASNCTNYVMQANMPKCPNQYSDYLYIEYECIPKSEVFDICSQSEKWATEGYIRSPDYPGHYRPSQACKCTLEASWGDSGVEFQIYELLLEQDKEVCKDWLMIKNGENKDRQCGQIFNKTVKVPNRVVDIYFYSDSNDVSTQVFQYFTRNLKGFWLYFKVITSNMKVSCGRLSPRDPVFMTLTIPPTTSKPTEPTPKHTVNDTRRYKPGLCQGGRQNCKNTIKSNNNAKTSAKRNTVSSADPTNMTLATSSVISTAVLLLLTLLLTI